MVDLTGVSAGKFVTETAGIVTNTSVGINTSTVDDNDLTGIGNSFQGLYISNGMVIHDNRLNGVHYIGTAFNGLMGWTSHYRWNIDHRWQLCCGLNI